MIPIRRLGDDLSPHHFHHHYLHLMLDDNLYPILSSGDSIGALLASDPVSLNCGRAVRCSSQCSHASTVFKVKTMVAMVMVMVVVMVIVMVMVAMVLIMGD